MAPVFGSSGGFSDGSAGFSITAKLLRGYNSVGYGCTSQVSSSEKPIDLLLQEMLRKKVDFVLHMCIINVCIKP